MQASEPRGNRVERLRTSRRWIGTTGPKQLRTTTFLFVLSKPTRVTFTVEQLSPTCRRIGSFSVAGRTGLNRVRFAGRVRGAQLAPGTYRISARTKSGLVVRQTTLVVVGGPAATLAELTSLSAANVCAGSTQLASANAITGSTGIGGGLPAQPPSASLSQPDAAGLGLPRPPKSNSGVLGSSVQKAAKAIQPLLVALLAVAIVLLSLASLPRVASEPRFNELLVRHRPEIAALGAASLLAVAVAFLLG